MSDGTRAGCPSELELSDAFGGEPPLEVNLHLARCPACQRTWASYGELAQRFAPFEPPAPSAREVRAIRGRIQQAAWAEARRRRALRRGASVGAALAATVALFVLALQRGSPAVRVEVEPGAELTRGEGAVHITRGRVEVTVAGKHGAPFVVRTADAWVELAHSRVRVLVERSSLREVMVLEGGAVVRTPGGTSSALEAGARWAPAPAPQLPGPVPVAPPAPASAPVPAPGAPTASAPHGAAPPQVAPAPRADARSRGVGRPLEPRRRERWPPDPGPPPHAPEVTTLDEELFLAAWTALREGRTGAAEEGFRALIEGHPGSALREDAEYWRVISLDSLRAREAALVLEQFLERHGASPRAGELSLLRARQLVREGDTARAREWLERARRGGDADVTSLALEQLRLLEP